MLSLALVLALSAAPNPQGVALRPRDPWVFRSVLDGRPRMVTLALSDELWVAYDATSCGLYKAWRGGVHFDGAVYTTVHGPQPTITGGVYTTGPDGDVWSITRDGVARAQKARYLGHLFHGGQVRLRYALPVDGAAPVTIEETPEFVRSERLFEDPAAVAPWLERGLVGLRRSFTASGVPPGVTVRLEVRADCRGYLIDRLLDVVESDEVVGGVRVRHLSGRLPLDAAAPANDLILFFDPPPPPPPPPETAGDKR